MKKVKNIVFTLIFLILNINIAYADVEFKTKRIKKEYSQLFKKNLELYQLVKRLDYVAFTMFNKNVVITEVYRTQKEQDRYYKGKPKFISPHQKWLAVDIRSRNFTEEEIDILVNAINKTTNYYNTYIPTAFYHDMGLGPHIHIQFKRRKK